MTRVDELQKKYPHLAREIIVKWDVLNHGIKDSEVVDKISVWDRAGSYQSRDLDVTLKEIAEKRPKTAVKPGYVIRPNPMYMKNGIGVYIRRASSSPYELREVGDDRFALYEGEQKVEDIYFVGPKPPSSEPLTSKGTPITSLVSYAGRCFRIAPVRFCEYFTRGEQCKFCNYNSTYEDARAVGHNPPTVINLEETVEAYKIASSNVRFVEGRFQMGAFRNSEQEAKVYIDFVDKIAHGASHTPNLTISAQPVDRKSMQRLKDAGLTCVQFNVEVWGAKLFEEVCPGKARYRGFEYYKQAWLEAVEIYGVGNVACNFAAGVSMLPANGHKTWQEARDSLEEGFRWQIKNGIFPSFIGLRLGVGSVYGDNPANRAKIPVTAFYLEAGLANHKAMVDFGLYEKLNRLMLCPFDCLTNMYCGEIGILELAGNTGNWAAQCVPSEANWLAKFIASVESSAKAPD